MACPRLNSQLVKLHFSYTVEEIARLLGVHKNTVRAWLKSGLRAIDSHHPTMVQGRELRTFLQNRRNDKKHKCSPGTIYCLKCRTSRVPALGMVDFISLTPTGGNLKALCSVCGSFMHRRVQINRISTVMPSITVRFTHPDSRLREIVVSSVNCESGKDPHI